MQPFFTAYFVLLKQLDTNNDIVLHAGRYQSTKKTRRKNIYIVLILEIQYLHTYI